MKVWMKKTGHILLQCAPLLVMLTITAAILLSGEEITVDTILNYTPEKTLPAILMLLMMYALKSLSVVFPMIVLYMASGIMFPLPLAILVNCIGLCIVVTIPYCIGRYSGGELSAGCGRNTRKSIPSSSSSKSMTLILSIWCGWSADFPETW